MTDLLLKTYGYLNFCVFQWFFTRLTAHFDDNDEFIKWSFRFNYPLTRWI